MISLLVVIIIVGVIVWFVNTYVPMPPAFKTLVYIVAGIFVLLYVLSAFGLIDAGMPRLRA
jgi:hypothetical protein